MCSAIFPNSVVNLCIDFFFARFRRASCDFNNNQIFAFFRFGDINYSCCSVRIIAFASIIMNGSFHIFCIFGTPYFPCSCYVHLYFSFCGVLPPRSAYFLFLYPFFSLSLFCTVVNYYLFVYPFRRSARIYYRAENFGDCQKYFFHSVLCPFCLCAMCAAVTSAEDFASVIFRAFFSLRLLQSSQKLNRASVQTLPSI